MGGHDKGIELGTLENTPAHEPFPEAAAACVCRQLGPSSSGSVLLEALQEIGK